MSFPLSGFRVADFGQLIAVPAATQMMAELGADVIKVEPPGGEAAHHMAAYGEAMLLAFNRGKRSMELDLKTTEGLGSARELLRRSDVFCHNLRPGTMERLGLGRDVVRELNPGIVNISVTGYNTSSPSADRPGLDIAAQAESGLMSITGAPDGEPQRVGAPVIDQTTAYHVVQAALAALLKRTRTGIGEDVEVSLFDAAIHLQSVTWLEQEVTGRVMRRVGNGQPTVAPGADVVTTANGAYVLTAYKQEHFERLCKLIGRPEIPSDPKFADNPARVANRVELMKIIGGSFPDMSAEECVRKLNEHGIVAAVIREYADVRTAADAVEGGAFVRVSRRDGPAYAAAVPAPRGGLFDHAVSAAAIPGLGEHTDEVLDWLRQPTAHSS